MIGQPGPRRDWESVAADRLHRMGRGNSAKALLGIDKRKGQHDERQAHEWRQEGKRRTTHDARPRSFFERLRRLLHI